MTDDLLTRLQKQIVPLYTDGVCALPRDLMESIMAERSECAAALHQRDATIARLDAQLNEPTLHDFAAGVRLEAAHQRARWGAAHDAGKEPQDWIWLIGFLAGKALAAHIAGDKEKALHHCISTAAACANWHAAVSGADNRMRPGIDPVERGVEAPAAIAAPGGENGEDEAPIAEAGERGNYVIMRRGFFYRPNAQGYTANINEAWKVPLWTAQKHANRNDPEPITIHHLSEFAPPTQGGE